MIKNGKLAHKESTFFDIATPNRYEMRSITKAVNEAVKKRGLQQDLSRHKRGKRYIRVNPVMCSIFHVPQV